MGTSTLFAICRWRKNHILSLQIEISHPSKQSKMRIKSIHFGANWYHETLKHRILPCLSRGAPRATIAPLIGHDLFSIKILIFAFCHRSNASEMASCTDDGNYYLLGTCYTKTGDTCTGDNGVNSSECGTGGFCVNNKCFAASWAWGEILMKIKSQNDFTKLPKIDQNIKFKILHRLVLQF